MVGKNRQRFSAEAILVNLNIPQQFFDRVQLLVANLWYSPCFLSLLGLGSGVLSYMLYSLRNSKQKLSVHLIHTRVLAQGSIVVVLSGMLFHQHYL